MPLDQSGTFDFCPAHRTDFQSLEPSRKAIEGPRLSGPRQPKIAVALAVRFNERREMNAGADPKSVRNNNGDN